MHYLEEFPLVLFTLLVQAVIGIVFIGQRLLAHNTDESVRKVVRFQSVIALFLFAFAVLITLMHTGTPLHSPFTILNIGSSWLSREIAMMGITGVCLVYLAYLRYNARPSSTEHLVANVTVILGAILCFVMSKIYTQPITAGWNTSALFPLYVSSALMLGACWYGLILSIKRSASFKSSGAELSPVLFWAVAGYILMATSIPMTLSDPNVAINPWTTLIPYKCILYTHGAHALLSGVAIFLLVQAIFRNSKRIRKGFSFTLFAFCFLIAGEVIGRLVFYLSYSRIGM